MAKTLDKNLIPAFHKNDLQAVRIIFREYYASMVQYGNQLINDRQETNELVVNTFIKLIAMRRNFRSLADIKAFLLVTVRNACYDYLSGVEMGTIYKRDMFRLADLLPANPQSMPVIFTSEMLLNLYEGINKLTGQCADVFKFYFYNRMTTADIALQLDMPVNKVRSQKTKAIRIIRSCLVPNLTITPSLN
ncbi:sigma-70 family RNA polymerase sigma factor [Paraflavitalea sp. CAU 1676]|uniref:RNA polymerase sigma factor n=1 Tax=Paraflavitalea sp. CAU 1676 TaxID=3032598 RepID=UPI0023DA824C|nr:sigma-70 family RNA polymerase sigma factor [Paraflavitalea sp. CAU 1676]MDF2187513.1 sigma-70 family RNA polymerase sigma factor [Paraflavitalea sp. CAU 1676]